MKILTISVGQPIIVKWQGNDVTTSIFKTTVSNSVQVLKENIEGDRQADLKVHGGADKAVYAYSYDTYPWWQSKLNVATLPYGSFGENLTIDSLDESQIFVGDLFEVGSCQLEAVQPRTPCFKLGIKFSNPSVVKTFNDFNRCGVYFRVKKEGHICAGDSLKLIASEKIKVSINELFQIYKNKNVATKSRAQEIIQIPSLDEKWRSRIQKILEAK